MKFSTLYTIAACVASTAMAIAPSPSRDRSSIMHFRGVLNDNSTENDSGNSNGGSGGGNDKDDGEDHDNGGGNDEHSDNRDNDNRFDHEEYEMSIKYQTDKIKIESKSPTIDITFDVMAKSTLSVKMKLKETTNSTELESKSRALIHYVQEWRDLNTDGIMQEGEKVGKAYKIGSSEGYNDIYPEPPDHPVYSYNFTIEEANNGPVTLIGHVVAIQNEFYDPSSLKFDLLFNDWQYQDAQNNQLAVLIEVRMETEMEYEKDGNEGVIAQEASSSAYSAFEWRTTFQYGDNEEGTIQTREATDAEVAELGIETEDDFEGEVPKFMWYCFGLDEAKGASRIFWDPSVKVTSSDPIPSGGGSSSSSSSPSDALSSGAVAGVVVGAVAGVAIVGALVFAVVKRMGGEPSAAAAAEEDSSKALSNNKKQMHDSKF